MPPRAHAPMTIASRARLRDPLSGLHAHASGGHHAARTDPRSRPSRPHGTADAEARREPEILRRRHGHDRERAEGRVGLSARLGRLRALFAQADGVEDLRHGAHGAARAQPAGAGAPRRRAQRLGLRHRLDRRRHGAGADLPLQGSRWPHRRALLRDRMVSGAAGAEAGAEEPGAALSRARRQCPPARPSQLPRRRHQGQPRVLRELSRLPPHRADRAQ